jgi:hypothetical protein
LFSGTIPGTSSVSGFALGSSGLTMSPPKVARRALVDREVPVRAERVLRTLRVLRVEPVRVEAVVLTAVVAADWATRATDGSAA